MACTVAFRWRCVLEFLSVSWPIPWPRRFLTFRDGGTESEVSGIARSHADLPRLWFRIHLHGGRARILRAKGFRARTSPLPELQAGSQTRPLRRERRANDVRC